MIKLDKINLSFDNKIILNNFSTTINKNEITCICGESGKGKTCLLKLLQGYIIPNSGKILFNNKVLTPASIYDIRKLTAWVPQNINLPINKSTELPNIIDATYCIDSFYKYAWELGISKDIMDADFSVISGGQRQRIIIAFCLALNKEIIIMDEPTAALDDHSIQVLIKIIKSLENKTIISASHNLEWQKNADKLIKL